MSTVNDEETLSHVQVPDHTFVLFGGTGDLAQRKLYPALFSLFLDGRLPSTYSVIALARRPLTESEFHKMVKDAILEFTRQSIPNDGTWDDFIRHFSYFPLDVHNPQSFCELAEHIEAAEKERNAPQQNRLFYLAMAPELFEPVANNLHQCQLAEVSGWKRLIIEKPFGRDYESAKHLNEQLRKVFQEEEIYRIDHYLGKEMVQNIEVIRFANSIFEPVWNNRSIANIQITSSETVGVEERAAYYEHSGALRDMIQNHMLQMVMMVAMEPPSRLKNEAIRDEKVKVLRSLRRYAPNEVCKHIVRGQYGAGRVQGETVPAYLDEHKVDRNSNTETFIAARLFIDNFRWAGVPFYLRTGKRMASKATEIIVQFRDMPKHLYFNPDGNLTPNLLVIRVSPAEGISLLLNAKRPGTDSESVVPVDMEFSEAASNTPEAYERLLHAAMIGDSAFFTRWDEVSLAWKFVDPIAEAFSSPDGPPLESYESGSYGPPGADDLIGETGHFWWPVAMPSDSSVKTATPHEMDTHEPSKA